MFKRIGLFLVLNFVVLITISVLVRLLGVDRWLTANGLKISRVATPLGVIGVIYESRPNVTADAGALCFKSGNAVILRGGSDSFHSSAMTTMPSDSL